MGTLSDILKLNIDTTNSKESASYILKFIADKGYITEVDDNHNIYITKGNSKDFPCFIGTLYGDRIEYQAEVKRILKNIWIGYKLLGGQPIPTSLGLSSKISMYVGLRLLSILDNVKLVFLTNALTQSVSMGFFSNARWVIQLEGCGNEEIVTQVVSTSLCSDTFKSELRNLLKNTDYCVSSGTRTDITGLKDKGLNVSAAILSTGYHTPYNGFHHVREADIEKALTMGATIANKLTSVYPYISIMHCVDCKKYLSMVEDYYCYTCLSKLRSAHSKCIECSGQLFSGEDFYRTKCRACRVNAQGSPA